MRSQMKADKWILGDAFWIWWFGEVFLSLLFAVLNNGFLRFKPFFPSPVEAISSYDEFLKIGEEA